MTSAQTIHLQLHHWIGNILICGSQHGDSDLHCYWTPYYRVKTEQVVTAISIDALMNMMGCGRYLACSSYLWALCSAKLPG